MNRNKHRRRLASSPIPDPASLNLLCIDKAKYLVHPTQCMAVRSSDDFITLYSQIYFACHTRHVHDPESGTRVSARQASILSHVDSVEPTPLSQLASHMGVTVSTMSIAVDRLVRQGYVVRDRAESDARVRHVRLTTAGERLRAAQKVLEPQLVRAMLSRLSPTERRDALRGLELLGKAAREQTKERRSNQPLPRQPR